MTSICKGGPYGTCKKHPGVSGAQYTKVKKEKPAKEGYIQPRSEDPVTPRIFSSKSSLLVAAFKATSRVILSWL